MHLERSSLLYPQHAFVSYPRYAAIFPQGRCEILRICKATPGSDQPKSPNVKEPLLLAKKAPGRHCFRRMNYAPAGCGQRYQ